MAGHDAIKPRIDGVVGDRIAHVEEIGEEARFFGGAVVHEEHRVFDRHQAVVGSL